MKTPIKIFTMFILIILLIRCDKTKVTSREYPRLKTLEVSDITNNGAIFNAEIIYRGNFEIKEYGFVWSEMENPIIENSDKVVYSDNIKSEKFSSTIFTTLKEGVSYHVRPFIKTNDYTVYGNNVSFLSLGSKAPELVSFTPQTGNWGDTITIYGNNFSYVTSNNIAKLGELASEIIFSSDSVLRIKVPPIKNNNTVKLKVSIHGNTVTSEEEFIYLIPEVSIINPISGTFNDTITINGENFGKIPSYSSVLFDDINSEIISANKSEIRVLVPEALLNRRCILKIKTVGYEFIYVESFKLNRPIITSFDPSIVTHPDDTITIKGFNFNPTDANNTIEIGGYPAQVIEASSNIIKVKLPKYIIPHYNISVIKDVSVRTIIAEQSTTAPTILKILWKSIWTRKTDFPGAARFNAVTFAINGKGYFGTGINQSFDYLNDFWEYEPITDTWKRIVNLPGGTRGSASSFMINNEGYVGLGKESVTWNSTLLKDFYKYNPNTETWTSIAEFTGLGRHSAASFAINNLGYIVSGWWGPDGPTNSEGTNEVWKYNPQYDLWTQISDFPGGSADGAGFTIENTGFIYAYNRLFKYSNNEWIQLPAPNLGASDNIAFSIKEKGYFGFGMPHQVDGSMYLWEYDPTTGASNEIKLYGGNRWGASVFVIDKKAYIIGGMTFKTGYYALKDVWEFDPTKPEL